MPLFKKLIILVAFTVILVFTLNIFYIDIGDKCFITIIPSVELSNGTIVSALQILKKVVPNQYTKVCENVKFINTNVSCGGFDGGCYHTGNNKTIYVSSSQRHLVVSTSVIAHETCHLLQEKQKRPLNEPECYSIGNTVLKTITQK